MQYLLIVVHIHFHSSFATFIRESIIYFYIFIAVYAYFLVNSLFLSYNNRKSKDTFRLTYSQGIAFYTGFWY